MKIKTNSTDSNEVREICGTAKMQNEIVNVICGSEESFLEIVGRLQNDEDMDDYVNNDGTIEIWGTRHLHCGEQGYRIHICVEETNLEKIGL